MAMTPRKGQSLRDWVFRPQELSPSEPCSSPPVQISLPGTHTLTIFQPSVSTTSFKLCLQPIFAWFCEACFVLLTMLVLLPAGCVTFRQLLNLSEFVIRKWK